MSTKELKEKLKKSIDNLSEEKLQELKGLILNLEKEQIQDGILSYAGLWADLDADLFRELTEDLSKRRDNKRKRLE